jgi:hypothetical protein
MGLQSCKNPNFENFETPKLGVLGQNDIRVLVSRLGAKNTTMGRCWLPPSPGHGESCESVFAFVRSCTKNVPIMH